MHIAVIGSRNYTDYYGLETVLDEFIESKCGSLYNECQIVSGGATGADTLAEMYANAKDMSIVIFRAEWKKYGRGAGFKRNKDIIDKADVVFAFWDGKSTGTKNSIELAEKANKQVYIIDVE